MMTPFNALLPLYDNRMVQALAERIANAHPLETPTAASGGIASKVDMLLAYDPEVMNELGLKLFRLGWHAIARFEDGSELRICKFWVNEYYNQEAANE